MNFLEKELEDLIYYSYKKDPEMLSKRGLYLSGNVKRQVNLGPYGIADLVFFNLRKKVDVFYKERILNINIVELKKELIDHSTLFQALAYYKGIQTIIRKEFPSIYNVNYKITLIGSKIEMNSNFCFLADFCSDIELITYKADLELGFTFEVHSGFCIKNSPQPKLSTNDSSFLRSILYDQDTYHTEQFIINYNKKVLNND